MTTRVRELVGPAGRPCSLCGSRRVVLVRSWDSPGALDRLRRRLGTVLETNERFTDECRDCGGRATVRPTTLDRLRPRVATTRPASS